MRLFFTFILAITVLGVNARQIPAEEAMNCAQNFLASKSYVPTRGTDTGVKNDLKLIKNESFNSIHAFSIGNSNGFVIVSAKGEYPMILGYSNKGKLEFQNLPPQLEGILKTSAVFKESGLTVSTRAGQSDILYETASWGQNEPYNNLAPNKAATGCVSTAMAITMQYHQWPDKTRGGVQTDWYFPEASMDFDNYKIDWSVLSSSNSSKFSEEVSKLMLSTGIASHMIYGTEEFSESAAEVWAISNRLVQLYSYGKDCQYITKDKFNEEEWNNMLRAQLEKVGPVIYRGGSDTAHCFVIDGCDSDGFYHVNWGWDGNMNGYYALDFSDVGGLDFGDYQGMIINIIPDKEKKEYSKAFISNADVYKIGDYVSSVWNFSTPDIDTGEPVYFIAPIVTLNQQQGFFRVAIVDESDNIIKLVGDEPRVTYNYHTSFDDAPYCAHPGINLSFNMEFPPLKEGQRYQLVSQDATIDPQTWVITPANPSNNPKDYKIILGGMLNPSYFYAKGNNSDYVKFNVHVDEDLPVWFEILNSDEKEFTLYKLRHDCFADNLSIPVSGVSMDINVTDKEGNEKEPIFSGYWHEHKYDFNISAYEDNHEVYFRFEKPENFRNDEGISSDNIFEQNGLVYEINDKEVKLIGYDKNKIDREVTVPDFVTVNDKKLTLTEINHDALILAPITNLNIDASHLTYIGNNAFGGIKNLENLSIKNMSSYEGYDYTRLPFLTSGISNIYLESNPSYGLVNDLFIYGINWTKKASREDVDVYMSTLPKPSDSYSYTSNWGYLSLSVRDQEDIENILGSLNIPGLGETQVQKEFLDYNFPVKEMWKYAIDKKNGMLSLSKVASNIKIDEVEVNGTIINPVKNGYYNLPEEALKSLEVKVNYTVNDFKKMTTVYSAEYNNALPSSTLDAAIEGITDDLEKVFDVYNLQGVKVFQKAGKEDIKSLNPGIYIIGSKKVVIK